MEYANLPDGVYNRAHIHYGLLRDGHNAQVLQGLLPRHDKRYSHIEVTNGVIRVVMQAELEAAKAAQTALSMEFAQADTQALQLLLKNSGGQTK